MPPTSPQVKQAKKKLTPVSPSKKRYRDSPKINDRLTYILRMQDPKVKRDKQLVRAIQNFLKKNTSK